MTKQLEYLNEEGLSPEKFLVFSPEMANQARHITGHANMCRPIEPEDSMKYFGEDGWIVVSAKWAKIAGLDVLQEEHEKGEKIPDRKLNDIPNLTPQQAFPEEEMPAPPPPPVPVVQAEATPTPPAPPITITEDDRCVFHEDGTPRDQVQIETIRALKSYGGRINFLEKRGFEKSTNANGYTYVHSDGITIYDSAIENMIKGYDFFDHYNKTMEDFNKAEREKVMEKVPEDIKEVVAASPNIHIVTVPKQEEVNEEVAKVPEKQERKARRYQMEDAGWTYNEEQGNFHIKDEPRVIKLDDVLACPEKSWEATLQSYERVAVNINIRLKKVAMEKAEREKKEAQDKAIGSILSSKDAGTEIESTPEENEKVKEAAKLSEDQEKSVEKFVEKVVNAPKKVEKKVPNVDPLAKHKIEVNKPVDRDGLDVTYATDEKTEPDFDKEALIEEMNFADQMAKVFANHSANLHALYQIRQAMESKGSSPDKLADIRQILNEL